MGGGIAQTRTRGRVHHPPVTSGDPVAEAREQFLAAASDESSGGLDDVRTIIRASWRRSRDWHVPADRIDLSYLGEPDLDTPLTRAAMPVLWQLRENLEGQPVSIILTGPTGLVLARLRAGSGLDRHLDGVQLSPGFSYSEQFVGTNGIGTALEGGRAEHVFGHEHYAENLEDLACAGTPIRHPISGRTVGLVDLTCWNKDADPLLIALSRTTADQIAGSMLADSSERELGLLQEYRRACRNVPGIVLGISDDMVMSNDEARLVLDPDDQMVLVGHAADALAGEHRAAIDVDLPSGIRARVRCRPVNTGDRPAGGIVHVRLLGSAQAASPAVWTVPAGNGAARAATGTKAIVSGAAAGTAVAAGPVAAVAGHDVTRTAWRGAGTQPARTPMPLPGLVGSGAVWLQACREVEAARLSGEWLVLEGEPGVGKQALLRAVHQRSDPAGHFRVLDAADAGPRWLAEVRRELTGSEGVLVIPHIDRLGRRQINALAAALQQARAALPADVLWLAVTRSGPGHDDLARLLRFFPGTVKVPPLRHHIEDVHELVPFFLGRLGHRAGISCSPEAMQLLLRSPWPGNAGQVWRVLQRVVRRRRSGAIQPQDLPPECWSVSRRLLTPLESIERDAITAGLMASNGNKVQAAEALGMSRATIYRKIRQYGIVIPASA
jgi:sigma-54 dependent transcriptional regulator, acetoin dehydrogenase operon transcriptional activator AcoR